MNDTDPVMPWVPMPWASRAACRAVGVDLFYPGTGHSIAAAVAVCEGCPVRDECLDHALEHEHYGVWAGTTERQRREIRHRRGGPRRRTNEAAQRRYAVVADIARRALAAGEPAGNAVLAAGIGYATQNAAQSAIRQARTYGHDIPYVRNDKKEGT